METYYQRLDELRRFGRDSLGLRSHRRLSPTARGLRRVARLTVGLVLLLVLSGGSR